MSDVWSDDEKDHKDDEFDGYDSDGNFVADQLAYRKKREADGRRKAKEAKDAAAKKAEAAAGIPKFEDEDLALPDITRTDIQSIMAKNLKVVEEKKIELRTEAIFALEHPGEELGPTFLDTPWQPPSLAISGQFRIDFVYQGGLANPGFTRVIDDNYHGDSVAMYFQFAKSFAYCFFYQFIFALPALAFAYYGSRVPSISRDIIGLYRFTLGNIGYVPSDSSFETDSACTQPANIVINASCVHIFSDYDLISSEFTYAEVSTILTVCELLQIMIFFITVFHIRRKLGLLKHEQVSGVDKGKVQLQDYSVFVMGLPSDSTLQELIQHFSGLYFLDRKDFRGRRPVRGATPVGDCDTAEDRTLYGGTWVAGGQMHMGLSKYIDFLRAKRHVMKRLYAARAEMKAYDYKSPHQGGARPQLFQRAEKKMLRLLEELDRMHLEFAKNKIGFVPQETEAQRLLREEESKRKATKLKPKIGKPNGKPSPNVSKPNQTGKPNGKPSPNASKPNQTGKPNGKPSPNTSKPNQTGKPNGKPSPNTSKPNQTGKPNGKPNPNVKSADSAGKKDEGVEMTPVVNKGLAVEDLGDEERGEGDDDKSVGSRPDEPPASNSGEEEAKTEKEKKEEEAARQMDVEAKKAASAAAAQADAEARKRAVEAAREAAKEPAKPTVRLGPVDTASKSQALDNGCMGAFITFEYAESRARAIEDSERFSSFPFSLWCPSALKFRGCTVQVAPASQPDDLFWQSMEMSPRVRSKRRALRYSLCFLALLVSYCVLVALAQTLLSFNSTLQDAYLCDEEIPNLYLSGGGDLGDYSVGDLQLTRPDGGSAALDSQCAAVTADAFYAVYTIGGDYSQIVGTYNITSCQSHGLCPSAYQSPLCPCVSPSATTTCYTLGCSTNTTSDECAAFPANTIDICYCRSSVTTLLSSGGGVLDTLQTLQDTATDSSCTAFFKGYGASIGLVYAAVVVTLVGNCVMFYAIKGLIIEEGYPTFSALKKATFNATFFCLLLNSVVVVIVAYGKVDGLPTFFETFYILQGSYDGFTPEWYSTVGSHIVICFVLQNFLPMLLRMYAFCIRDSVRRYMHFGPIEGQRQKVYFSQHELNMLEVGPVFQVTSHLTILMSSMFVATTFGAGIPALSFLGFLVFVTYFQMDKRMYLRHYQQPRYLADRVIRQALDYMPYAGILRVCFAVWMLSNSDIVYPYIAGSAAAEGTVIIEDTSIYTTLLATYSKLYVPSYILELTYVQRALQENTFPLTLVLVVAVLVKVLLRAARTVLYMAARAHKCCKSMRSDSKSGAAKVHPYAAAAGEATADGTKATASDDFIDPYELFLLKDPIRTQVAPFRGAYYRFVSADKVQHSVAAVGCCSCCSQPITMVSDEERTEGWIVEDYESSEGTLANVMIKQWVEQAMLPGGIIRQKGQRKRTYEVLRELGASESYSFTSMPAFKIILTDREENISDFMLYQHKIRKSKGAFVAPNYLEFKLSVSNVDSTYNPYEPTKVPLINLVDHYRAYKAAVDVRPKESKEELERRRVFNKDNLKAARKERKEKLKQAAKERKERGERGEEEEEEDGGLSGGMDKKREKDGGEGTSPKKEKSEKSFGLFSMEDSDSDSDSDSSEEEEDFDTMLAKKLQQNLNDFNS